MKKPFLMLWLAVGAAVLIYISRRGSSAAGSAFAQPGAAAPPLTPAATFAHDASGNPISAPLRFP